MLKHSAAPVSGAYVGASWACFLLAILVYCIGLWNASFALSEKGYYFSVLLQGLFAAVSLQKTVRDRMEGLPVSGIYYGVCWAGLALAILLFAVGVWNSSMASAEKGFYAMAYVLALFASVVVQKNVRDNALVAGGDGEDDAPDIE